MCVTAERGSPLRLRISHIIEGLKAFHKLFHFGCSHTAALSRTERIGNNWRSGRIENRCGFATICALLRSVLREPWAFRKPLLLAARHTGSELCVMLCDITPFEPDYSGLLLSGIEKAKVR